MLYTPNSSSSEKVILLFKIPGKRPQNWTPPVVVQKQLTKQQVFWEWMKTKHGFLATSVLSNYINGLSEFNFDSSLNELGLTKNETIVQLNNIYKSLYNRDIVEPSEKSFEIRMPQINPIRDSIISRNINIKETSPSEFSHSPSYNGLSKAGVHSVESLYEYGDGRRHLDSSAVSFSPESRTGSLHHIAKDTPSPIKPLNINTEYIQSVQIFKDSSNSGNKHPNNTNEKQYSVHTNQKLQVVDHLDLKDFESSFQDSINKLKSRDSSTSRPGVSKILQVGTNIKKEQSTTHLNQNALSNSQKPQISEKIIFFQSGDSSKQDTRSILQPDSTRDGLINLNYNHANSNVSPYKQLPEAGLGSQQYVDDFDKVSSISGVQLSGMQTNVVTRDASPTHYNQYFTNDQRKNEIKSENLGEENITSVSTRNIEFTDNRIGVNNNFMTTLEEQNESDIQYDSVSRSALRDALMSEMGSAPMSSMIQSRLFNWRDK
ncbi:hypothetical protein BB559_004084 [Furculomyces boomerangus]|uniref:Uncharacterized protein n=1 Tax=Furculomyces boomerangus TaxID=61424 RepID=A0A2T9YGS7_9FUNG|nr:hypothetical protein BB559_004084 [Furculomyces boomerangus]